MPSEDRIYYRERADTHRTSAGDSADPRIVKIHSQLARLYDELTEAKSAPASPQ